MLHGMTRTSTALFLLTAFGLTPASAAPVSVSGSTAVAVAGLGLAVKLGASVYG